MPRRRLQLKELAALSGTKQRSSPVRPPRWRYSIPPTRWSGASSSTGKALGGADLWPRCVSTDERYLLAATYREMAFHRGRPGSVWEPVAEKYVLLDLATGKLVPGFDMGSLKWPHWGNVAVMAPSRQVLIIDTHPGSRGHPNKNHGIWAVPFDGGAVKAAGRGLPKTWNGGTIAFGGGWAARSATADRLAMVPRPEVRGVMAPDPRQLLVFWNSARPIRAWISKGMADEPKNVTWSRKGKLLAFTSGKMLYVWQPTEKPGEPKLPVERKQKPEVF